ncbi:MAG: DUF3365 domain-containing protein [Leptolyngbya sp. SIO4C1]|nr:DUF3365 domain-containing protein [Leptolyngbya sp. SIO4C1]
MIRQLQDLRLGQKFTIMLLIVFISGIAISGVALSHLLNRSAQAELTNKALMLMETMNSVRSYTSNEIQPELVDELETTFLPETVPAYSAHQVFDKLRESNAYSDFYYKEAVLNPTNPQDKADPFEADIIAAFRQQQTPKEVSGFRRIPTGDLYYIARPIKVTQPSCLECHGTAAQAPKSMVERYGATNGFGWQLGNIVGAQMISVPAERVLQNARQALVLILGTFIVVFAITIFLVNLWLKRYVVRPINRMAMTAEAVSLGDTKAEFVRTSKDEVGNLTDSFNRMRLSLQMAMQRLERYRSSRSSGGLSK